MNRKDLLLLALMLASLALPRAFAQPAPAVNPESNTPGEAPPPSSPPPAPAPGDATTPPASPDEAPAPESPRAEAPPRPLPPDPCLKAEDGALADTLRDLSIQIGGESRLISDVRLTGLVHLDEAKLWHLVGPKPKGPLALETATMLVARLARTGLFSKLTPTVQVDPAGGATLLEVAVVEQPFVSRVVISGLSETDPAELLGIMLNASSARAHRGEDKDHDEDGDEDDDKDDDDEDDKPRIEVTGRCSEPTPPSDWLVRVRDGAVQPGIARNGLTPALQRAVGHLWDAGYLLASLTAELSPDGTLVLNVDEGHLRDVNLEGVDPGLEPQVRRELGLQRGQVFLLADLEQGVERVKEHIPFLTTRVRGASLRPDLHVREQLASDGSRHYDLGLPTDSFKDVDVRISVNGQDELRLRVEGAPWEWVTPQPKHHGRHHRKDEKGDQDVRLSVSAKSVTVRFKSVRTALSDDWRELFRYTQVSGYSPGVMLTGWLWDPANRVNLAVDAGINLNLGLPSRPLDWTFSPRLQLPFLRIAEVGAHFHSLTDTSDRWRVGPLDSYINAFFFNLPEREYYRRTGGEGFITLHLFEQLTAGASYRLDSYESLPSLVPLWTVFNRGVVFPNSPIDEGRFGSLLFRLEWSTERVPLDHVGSPWRAPETSLVERDLMHKLGSGFTTVNTVEIANAGLGTDAGLNFVRAVSDNFLHLSTGHDQGLRLRLRAAGGTHLPAQKQEALGGWNALRGYDFKEFRGDMSVLGMGEYHYGFLSVFADVGSVRQTEGWLLPKLGLGAALNFGDEIQLAAAWRADERARWVPEARVIVQRTF